jgi:hypothetical protein
MGLLGGAFVLLSVFLWFFGGVAIFLHAFSDQQSDSQGGICEHTLCCVMLFTIGAMMLRSQENKERGPILLVAAGCTLLLTVTLLVASGLIVIYATCLGGF